ncbi:MAG: VanZ family protein [bacterium]|nr:VanZ family protein [bacterium]
MTNHLNAIILGIGNFPFFAVICTLPILAFTIIKYRTINIVRIAMDYALVLYLCCLVSVVIFPLPSVEQAAALNSHDIQLIPFHFIADFIREPQFWVKKQVILQVVCNVIMTMPIGMFLRYYYGTSKRKVIVISLVVSFLIELTQLTGIYGIYKGSYRLCDMDDLIANTFGGYLGYRFIASIEKVIPAITAFDVRLTRKGHSYHQGNASI